MRLTGQKPTQPRIGRSNNMNLSIVDHLLDLYLDLEEVANGRAHLELRNLTQTQFGVCNPQAFTIAKKTVGLIINLIRKHHRMTPEEHYEQAKSATPLWRTTINPDDMDPNLPRSYDHLNRKDK